MKQRVMVVLGTRPEVIKLAPVIAELRTRGGDFHVVVCVTGQHREMIDPLIAFFGVGVDHDLRVMVHQQGLAELTARMLSSLELLFAQVQPDCVVVQGDTTTAMVAAMVAFYRNIKVAHVEAGLRTYNLQQPFPEEVNRRFIDMLAEVCYAPTARARNNLLREHVDDTRIVVTGNSGIDALLLAAAQPFSWSGTTLSFVSEGRRVVLVTAHRRESFGEPFHDLCRGIRKLAREFRDVDFIYPVHLNPKVQTVVREDLSGLDNVHLLPPVDYLTSVKLLQRATLVMTDSGGIQEEAPSFGCPILVLRETTERQEAVTAGFAVLVGTDSAAIITAAGAILSRTHEDTRISGDNPFGDGRASERIVAHLGRLVSCNTGKPAKA